MLMFEGHKILFSGGLFTIDKTAHLIYQTAIKPYQVWITLDDKLMWNLTNWMQNLRKATQILYPAETHNYKS